MKVKNTQKIIKETKQINVIVAEFSEEEVKEMLIHYLESIGVELRAEDISINVKGEFKNVSICLGEGQI